METGRAGGLQAAVLDADCVVCGAPSRGAIVCGSCETDRGQVADTLIIVRGAESAEARVPRAVSDAALARVRAGGRNAAAVPLALAWTALPRATWLLITLVLVAGIGAVRFEVMADLGPTIAVALCVLAAATASLRRPRLTRGAPLFPPALHDTMLRTLTELPRGPARDQLSALSAKVRAYHELRARYATLAPFAAGVTDLFAAACDASRDLASVDRLLSPGGPANADGSRSADLVAERQALAEQLIAAADHVDRICHHGLEERDEAAFDELLDDVHRATEALREVSAIGR